MKKMRKTAAVWVAALILGTSPVTAMAAEYSTEQVIMDNIDTLLSDPGQVADVIVSVKDMIEQQQITEDQLREGVGIACEKLGLSLTDEEMESLAGVAKKLIDMDIDGEKLRSQIEDIYGKIEGIGIEKEEIKGFVQRAIEFVKSILE